MHIITIEPRDDEQYDQIEDALESIRGGSWYGRQVHYVPECNHFTIALVKIDYETVEKLLAHIDVELGIWECEGEYAIVANDTVMGTGATPEEALEDSKQWGIREDTELDDCVPNINGSQYRVTSDDVVLTDDPAIIYAATVGAELGAAYHGYVSNNQRYTFLDCLGKAKSL